MTYEILSHTADFRMKVTGKDLTELFESAFLGMTDYLKKEKEKRDMEREITIFSPDETALLVDFLNEILVLSNVNKEIYSKVLFEKLEPTELKAKIYGSKTNEFDHDIKAVTYHEAEIVKNKKGEYETNLVFDI